MFYTQRQLCVVVLLYSLFVGTAYACHEQEEQFALEEYCQSLAQEKPHDKQGVIKTNKRPGTKRQTPYPTVLTWHEMKNQRSGKAMFQTITPYSRPVVTTYQDDLTQLFIRLSAQIEQIEQTPAQDDANAFLTFVHYPATLIDEVISSKKVEPNKRLYTLTKALESHENRVDQDRKVDQEQLSLLIASFQ
jgi:hypothetical protein